MMVVESMPPCCPDALKAGGNWMRQLTDVPFCEAVQPPDGPVPLNEAIDPVTVTVAVMERYGFPLSTHPPVPQFTGVSVMFIPRWLIPFCVRLRLPAMLPETEL